MNPTLSSRTFVNSLLVRSFNTFPPIAISPSVGDNKAPAIDKNVLFPAPEGPTIATNSPCATSKDTFFNTSMTCSPS
ncbi:conserved hypothetical protein [Listeria monocytogenes str. 4b H7858]|nr:conserved hypothetical protein [Listeria monocytogenes str. 4b H7858] [Listeria monocytogenes serotype 4b str. H7858]